MATASLRRDATPPGSSLAWFAFAFCVVVSVSSLVLAVGTHHGAWTRRSFFMATFVPSINVWTSTFLAVLAVLAAGAKRSMRGGPGARSAEIQEAFRAAMTRALSLIAIVTCAALVMMSVEVSRVHREHLERPSSVILLLGGFALLFIVGTMVRVMRRFGQGGAFRESASAETPLTNGLADNARWVLGLFYVNPHDPSIMVESRFGFGYTFNYGNWIAILILAAFLALALALIVFWVAAPIVGGG